MNQYLTAKQAAAALGVSRATLYAYTSRGQIRSEPVAERTRERRYARDDVTRLKERKAARRDPAKAAAQGLRWGEPVLESSITLIHDGTFYYRGHDAVALAGHASVEHVAALLWQAPGDEAERLFAQPLPIDARGLAPLRRATRDQRSLMQAMLPIAGAADVASYDLRPASVRASSARILRLLASVVTGRAVREPIHQALQEAWTPRRPAAADAIRSALVLCADHELNVSAFAARCAASAGAPPYDVVSAALATLKGFRHGGAAERALSLAERAGTPSRARHAIVERLRHGDPIPAFGHPLYPHGDPRAVALMRSAESSGNDAAWRPFRNLRNAGVDLLNEQPNLDFGLAAVTRCYRLPSEAPFILFALGRTIGWMAHAMEEYTSGRLIRPRARYVGPPPVAQV
ncbi:MAG: citrate synthase family protein [bacterium]